MSGASVSCRTVSQTTDSVCMDCDWFERDVPSGQSQGLSHAMEAGHETRIRSITNSIAAGVSKEDAHGSVNAAGQRNGSTAADGKA